MPFVHQWQRNCEEKILWKTILMFGENSSVPWTPPVLLSTNYNQKEIFELPVFICTVCETDCSDNTTWQHGQEINYNFSIRNMYVFRKTFVTNKQNVMRVIIVLAHIICATQTANDKYAEFMRTNKMNCTDAETGTSSSFVFKLKFNTHFNGN